MDFEFIMKTSMYCKKYSLLVSITENASFRNISTAFNMKHRHAISVKINIENQKFTPFMNWVIHKRKKKTENRK